MGGIKAQLESDPGITDPKERCSLYVQTFRSGGFDEDEYRNFGPEGCGAYDLAGFQGESRTRLPKCGFHQRMLQYGDV
jgi:hypothetical protein